MPGIWYADIARKLLISSGKLAYTLINAFIPGHQLIHDHFPSQSGYVFMIFEQDLVHFPFIIQAIRIKFGDQLLQDDLPLFPLGR